MARLPQVRPSGITANPSQASASAIEGQAAMSAFSELSDAASDLRRRAQPYLNRQAEDRAAEDVRSAFDERGDELTLPEVRRRLPFTEQDEAYNNAMQASFVARSRLDVEQEVARLRLSNLGDPEAFGAAAEAFTRSYLGMGDGQEPPDVPGNVLTAVEMSIRERFSIEQSRLAERAAIASIEESRDNLERSLTVIEAELDTMIAEQGPGAVNTPRGQELMQEAIDNVGLLVDNPLMGRSEQWGSERLNRLANLGEEAMLRHEVRAEYEANGPVAALEMIDEQVRSMNLTPEQRIGVRSRLVSVVNERETINNLQRQARVLARQEAEQRNRAAFDAWQAEVFSYRQQNQPVPEELVRMAPGFIAGGASPASISALLDNDPTRAVEDDAAVAQLMWQARTGNMTEEELNQAMTPMLGSNSLQFETYNQVLNARRSYDELQRTVGSEGRAAEDRRLSRGEETIAAYTSRSPFADDYANLAVMEEEMLDDFYAYAEANPDATRAQLRQYALGLAVERGREIPPPPIEGLARAPVAPSAYQVSEQTVAEYLRGAARAIDSVRDEDEQNRLYRDLEQWEQWARYQMNLSTAQQGGSNNAQ